MRGFVQTGNPLMFQGIRTHTIIARSIAKKVGIKRVEVAFLKIQPNYSLAVSNLFFGEKLFSG